MNYLEPQNLQELQFLMILQALEQPIWTCTTTQRLVQGWDYEIPGWLWREPTGMNMEDFGFKLGNKLKQLLRNYRNPESIEKGRKLLIARQSNTNNGYTSIGFSMLGEEKKRSQQGHCMRALNVAFAMKTRHEKVFKLRVDVFYRMVELTRRFPTDIILIRDYILPEILKDFPPYEIEIVRFHFSVLSIHCQFINPMLGKVEDPTAFLEEIRARDPQHHRRIALHLARLIHAIDSGRVITFQQVARPMIKFKALLEAGTINGPELRIYLNRFMPAGKELSL